MANPFDQFDAPAKANPFDQFDQAQAPTVPQQAPPQTLSEQIERENINPWTLTKEAVAGIAEPALAIGSGVAGQVAGGLAGLGTLPIAGSERAAQVVENVQEGMQYTPRTPAGRESLKTIGELAQTGLDVANIPLSGVAGVGTLLSTLDPAEANRTVQDFQEKGFSQAFGDKVFEITDSPLLASAAVASPEILGSLVPARQISRSRTAFKDELAARIRQRQAQDATFEGQAIKEATDEEFARYLIDGQKGLQADKLAQETLRQGFDEGVVATVKGASPTDRRKMLEMLNIRRKGEQNARYAQENRASDVAGRSALEQVNFVKQKNKEAGKQLDKVANSLKGKPVDYSQPVDDFLDDLEQMGVTFNERMEPNFKNSDIEGLSGLENTISRVVKRMRDTRAPDAYDLHRMKKYIDQTVSYGKPAEGLNATTERILKNLRRGIDQTLDNNFPEYNQVNTQYADTIQVLNSIQDSMGRKVDLFGPQADKAVGTRLRTLMSNTQSRANMLDSIQELNRVSRKYGADFDDDLITQMLFADELDDIFGSSARTSFQGQIQQGVESAIEQGPTQPLMKQAAIKAGKVAENLRGINDEARFDSMEELLKRD